jgi:hypothetical protein
MAMIQKYTAKENQSMFEDGARTRRTAGLKYVVAQYARTDIKMHSFAVRAVECWHRLPNSIRAESRPERFKQRLQVDKA